MKRVRNGIANNVFLRTKVMEYVLTISEGMNLGKDK